MESTANKITVTVAGSNRVELVQNLRAFADSLDGMPAETTGKVAAKPASKKAAPAKSAPAADDDDDGFVTEAAGGEPAGFDDDAETETVDASADADDDFTEEPPKKSAAKGTKKATKKITLDDVNDACKAHAAAKGRPATLAILQKKFKTQSVTALKPEQYESCIAAMAVN